MSTRLRYFDTADMGLSIDLRAQLGAESVG
jgi:hypothetical protein